MGQGIPTTEELRALGLVGAVETLLAQNAALRAEVGRLETQREDVGVKLCALQAQMGGDKFRMRVQELATALLRPEGEAGGESP